MSSLTVSGIRCPKGCGEWLVFTADAIGRMRERCPKCDGTARATPPRPGELRAPQIAALPADPPPRRPTPPLQSVSLSPGDPSRSRSLSQKPSAEPSMATKVYPKKCARSGKAFTSPGPAGKFCGTCPECRAIASGDSPPEKKRKPASTGFVPPRSTPAASGSGIEGAIEKLEEEIATLDARRERLLGLIETMREFEAA